MTTREYVKALIDRLTDEQVKALEIILNSMAWKEDSLSKEEILRVDQAVAELGSGLGVKAEDVW